MPARPALATGAALVALLILVAARAIRRFSHNGGRAIRAAVIVLCIAAVLVPLLSGRAVMSGGPGATAETGAWQRYDAAALKRMVAGGQVVFVDVTAAWCLICKANELTVLERAPVADKLRAPAIATMRADWTRPDPAITAYLESFGRYGVPLDVVYGPGAPAGIALPELLRSGAVMTAFEQAALGPAGHWQAAECAFIGAACCRAWCIWR